MFKGYHIDGPIMGVLSHLVLRKYWYLMGQQYVQIYTLPFTNEEYFLFLYILFPRGIQVHSCGIHVSKIGTPRIFVPFMHIMENWITFYGKKYTDTVEMNPQTRR